MNYTSLIGTPYSEMDCWKIVVEFYRIVFNIELKKYYENVPESKDIAKRIIYDSIEDFEEVKNDKKFGDILLIRLRGVESHIAVFLGEGRILHTTNHSGCVIDRFQKWEKSLVGVYRAKTK